MRRSGDPATAGLLFPWGAKPASFWRLLPFLGFSLLALAGFFIIFKISYPVSDPVPRSAQGILMLDPDQPAHQFVLNRVYDRSALILESKPSIAPLHSGPLLPLFRPSFQDFEMRLKETAQQESSVTAHRLFQPSDLALPKVSSFSRIVRRSSKALPEAQFSLQVQFSPPLDDRPLLRPPNLSNFSPQDLSRLRFHLTVNSLGRVILALPLSASTEDRPLIPALQTALSQVRFAPLPNAKNQVGVTSFVWQPSFSRD